MADVFGDPSLFSEFERDRDTQNIFIQYDRDESGSENRSRIIFSGARSDSDDTDKEDADDQETRGEKETTPGTDGGSENSQESKVAQARKEEPIEEDEQSSAPQSTPYQENFEKNKIRQFARIIDSTRCVADEQSPAIQLIFQNNKFAKKYRGRIEQYIISLTEHADKKDFTKTATDLTSKPTTVSTCVDLNDQLPSEKRNTRMWQAHAIIGCAQFHNGFMVDTRGWPLEEDDSKDSGCAEIPKYCQVFEEVFPSDVSAEQSLKPPGKPKDACFNCGGDHRLNECVAPRDQNRIRAKRRERQENSSKQSNPGRYHEDPELNPKRAKFVAGSISDSLREAIGLKSDQLPPYVYRMRMYGYPPGWLLEANRKTSALAMYDKDGRETNLRGESLEDGEYSEQSSGATAEFDVNKIIEYPGFTVAVPMGFVDESDSKGMPNIQQHQLKKTLTEEMATREAAKKRRLEEEGTDSRKKLKKSGDKDVAGKEEKAPAPQKTSTPGEGEKPGKETTKKGEEEGEEAESPSMDSLQQEYHKLIDQLDSDGDSNMANGNSSSATPGAAATATATAQPEPSPEKSASELLREKNFSFSSSNASVSKDFGTPILVRKKSIKVLPAAEKFSQGVEEHIPFENLPDSVGTFAKMKNLFSLVRDKIKKPKK